MLIPPDRKGGALKRRLRRVLTLAALAGFSCTFPDYAFESLAPDTCFNGSKDADEAQIDCGGSCAACEMCQVDAECEGRPCVNGYCRAPCLDPGCVVSCDDGVQNGMETAKDCGGSCPDKCDTGDTCRKADDCTHGVCDETCQAPTCSDDVINGGESDLDCGEVCEERCAEGQACGVGADCESELCTAERCAPQHCANGSQDVNRGETDIDCGGDSSNCRRCDVDETCLVDSDCSEQVCSGGVCQAATCDDQRANGLETGEDCGGASDCDRCEPGEPCAEHSDCVEGVCVDDSCQEPTCEDTVQNDDETDVDCGGSCSPCGDGEKCEDGADCASQICAEEANDEPNRVCSAATCSDQIQNGRELGLDCGGADCALCELGADCSSDAACASFSCIDGWCVEGVSVSYRCGQCGDGQVMDMVSYWLILRNLTDREIDVDDLSIRYYLSADTTDNLNFDCSYNDTLSCGDDPRLVESDIGNSQATHYIETTLTSTLPALAANEAAEVFIEVTWPDGGFMQQNDDHSFNRDPQSPYGRTPLYRGGSLIWGTEPAPTN